MEETITLKEILETLRKNTWIIICCMIISAVGVFGFMNFFVTPKYEAISQVLITQNAQDQNAAVQNSEIQANIQMVNTYGVVIKSPRILKIAADEIGSGMTLESLASRVSVDSVQNSQVINIHVVDDNPEEAIRMVQIVTKNFLKETPDMLKIKNVELLANAYSAQKISPNAKLGLLAGMFAGLVIGVIISFGRRIFDERFKKEEEITSRLKIPVIGTIGNIVRSENGYDSDQKMRRRDKK
ncbi:hypothetical protein HB818_16735 [Listeria booriae]|uniref:YveK family protein n=1 Tax=Listeria booriae TaxID=1552123 RepID=UPI001627921A|nr:Wzz/FepE/Etk N-terminal domain-containing protein [Listeria booriae]MBC1287404.1 hypothetical protein [Listeria booriae]